MQTGPRFYLRRTIGVAWFTLNPIGASVHVLKIGKRGTGSILDTDFMTEKPLAHIYVRHSTKAQASGDSHRRQMQRAREWAEKNGHQLKEIYDSGVSGFTGANRTLGQLGRFVESLKAGELGASPVLLVEAFDRLSREDLNTAQGLFLSLLNSGATVVTLVNGKVPDDSQTSTSATVKNRHKSR